MAADTRLNEFTPLKCECGGDLFVVLVKLKYKSEGGTITEPGGHWCVACHAVVDNRYMIRLVDLERKRQEVARLQAELAEQVAAGIPVGVKQAR